MEMLFVILISKLLLATADDSTPETQFPSIKTLSTSDTNSFSIAQPSLDLDPTNLAQNAPMIMSLPELSSNLEETDFAKNFKMDFSITQPKLDLTPSFEIDFQHAGKERESKLTDEKSESEPETRNKRDGMIDKKFILSFFLNTKTP